MKFKCFEMPDVQSLVWKMQEGDEGDALWGATVQGCIKKSMAVVERGWGRALRRPIFGILWVESEGLENGGQGIDVLAGEDLDAPEGGALVADVAARALPDESSSFAGAVHGRTKRAGWRAAMLVMRR